MFSDAGPGLEKLLTNKPPMLPERAHPATRYLDEIELINTLQALVRIRSVFEPGSAHGNEKRVADLICFLLDEWELPYRRWDVAPGRPNIVAEVPGSLPGPVLIFEGHMDVVTEGDRGSWTYDPYSADIVDGKLYGRGSADMKSGLTAMLFAARAIQLSGVEFTGTIRLAILSDEEGMMLGARGFVGAGYLNDAMAAIICEPEGGRVCTAQKGALRLLARLHGTMSHGCMPEEGANPVAALGAFIVACSQLEREVQAEHPPHPTLGRFYLTPTVVSAGAPEQANVVHAIAEVFLDVRTCPFHNHEALIERIQERLLKVVTEFDGISGEIDVVDDRPATESAHDDNIVQAVVNAHEVVFGTTPPYGGVPGSTDGTIFWAANQLPLVVYGPGDTTIPHQANEFVRVDEVLQCARVFVDAALRYFELMEES